MIEQAASSVLTTLTQVLSDYLREQFQPTVSELQRKEEASEVLVGFLPDIAEEALEMLTPLSDAPIGERATTLQEAQSSVEDRFVDTLISVEPTKKEASLPGIDSVEHDLSQIHDEQQIDSSWLTNIVRLRATPSMIGQLARKRQVAFVVPNVETRLPQPVKVTESDVKSVRDRENEQGKTWGIEYLQIPKLWDEGLTGENVVIGHLDSGIDASHPDLKDKIEEFALLDPRSHVVKSDAFDSSYHGTHTAGTIVGGSSSGICIGVAPKAKLASALVLMRGNGTVWQVVKGMEWAVAKRARVLNLSLGGTGYNSLYEYALTRVISIGVFPSCSVGNGGLATTGSPGNIGMACGVGAIDRRGMVADFSGGGSISWYNPQGQFVEIQKPDVVAPGVGIRSSLPEGRWDYLNGTSMAAPHVSGLMALFIQAKPSARLTDLFRAIYETAVHPAAIERPRDSRFGRGIIDPMRALERLGS